MNVDEMSEPEAKAEAQRRWRAHAGWAGTEVYEFMGKERVRCVVGIMTSDGHFTHRVTLGRGRTFERAFESAENKIARERAKAPRKRKVAHGPWEQMDLLEPRG